MSRNSVQGRIIFSSFNCLFSPPAVDEVHDFACEIFIKEIKHFALLKRFQIGFIVWMVFRNDLNLIEDKYLVSSLWGIY